jgi:FkbM family methyltransferase
VALIVRAAKDAVWRVLARLVSTGVRWLRRRPGPATADEWRAASVSYSHFGEDLIVLKLLGDRAKDPNKGVYVDVGAFDPVFFSNTLLLRQHGWTGVNIDGNSDRVALLQRRRPTDLCLWAVVSDTVRTVKYVRYPTEGLSGLIEATDSPGANVRGELPTQVDEVKTCTLTELLNRLLPPGIAIDFLNVDCEGHDVRVLAGLDWSRWRPRVVAAEANSPPEREQLVGFMRGHGYEVAASLFITLIFAPTAEGTG